MKPTEPSKHLGDQLLQQESSSSGAEYDDYRKKLEAALERSERRKTLVGRVALIAFVTSFVLMFVGGTRVVGSFDPWDARATPLSMILGVIYFLSLVVAPVALVSFVVRWLQVGKARGQMRDLAVEQLQREVRQLHEQLSKEGEGGAT
jgi:uncharacterized membrane protein